MKTLRRAAGALLCLVVLQVATVAPAQVITWEQPYQAHQYQHQMVGYLPGSYAGIQNTRDIDYPMDWNDSWDSIRTFRLLHPLLEPVRVYIAPVPSGAAGNAEKYRGYVTQSLDTWSEALDNRLKYVVVDDPRKANIKVFWVDSFPSRYQAGETECNWEYAVVKIKLDGLRDNVILSNILHEFGHALGITSHSDHNDDIMRTFRDWRSYEEYVNYKPKLSSRDVKAIRRLYSRQWQKGEDLYAAVDRIPVAVTP
jgi:hypothetical protein